MPWRNMNLLIRYKADMADTQEEFRKQWDIADTWMTKTLDTRKIKADKKASDDAKGIKTKQ